MARKRKRSRYRAKRKSPNRYNVEPLRRARDDRGFTNTVIARALGRPIPTVSLTISGHPHAQGPATVKAIADFLGVPMIELRPPAPEPVAVPEEAVA